MQLIFWKKNIFLDSLRYPCALTPQKPTKPLFRETIVLVHRAYFIAYSIILQQLLTPLIATMGGLPSKTLFSGSMTCTMLSVITGITVSIFWCIAIDYLVVLLYHRLKPACAPAKQALLICAAGHFTTEPIFLESISLLGYITETDWSASATRLSGTDQRQLSLSKLRSYGWYYLLV